MDDLDRYRPLLLSLAYRMTGRAGEAEDLVQDAYVDVLTAVDGGDGERPARDGLVAALVPRCLAYLSSDEVREAHYEGPWLPEPVLTAGDALPPLDTAAGRATISLPVLALLDALAPEDRAAYLLRDTFGYGDEKVARLLDMDLADARRAYERAARRVAASPPVEYAPEAHRRAIERLILACYGGDAEEVKGVLAEGVTAWTDGGGQVAAALRPVEGRDAVARYLAGFIRKLPIPAPVPVPVPIAPASDSGADAGTGAGAALTYAEVNGGAGLLAERDEELAGVIAFDVAGGAVRGVRLMLNRDKLAFIERQLRESR